MSAAELGWAWAEPRAASNAMTKGQGQLKQNPWEVHLPEGPPVSPSRNSGPQKGPALHGGT